MSIAKLTIYAGFPDIFLGNCELEGICGEGKIEIFHFPDISACFFLTLALFHSGAFLILCRVESDAK